MSEVNEAPVYPTGEKPEGVTVGEVIYTFVQSGKNFDEIRRMTVQEFVTAAQEATGKRLVA